MKRIIRSLTKYLCPRNIMEHPNKAHIDKKLFNDYEFITYDFSSIIIYHQYKDTTYVHLYTKQYKFIDSNSIDDIFDILDSIDDIKNSKSVTYVTCNFWVKWMKLSEIAKETYAVDAELVEKHKVLFDMHINRPNIFTKE